MINTDLILWFNSGIGIGFVILTTLLLFPGINQDGFVKFENENSSNNAKGDCKKIQTIQSMPSSSSLPDDNGDQGEYAFTPYQKMNFAVYVTLCVVAGIILDREYGGMLGIWLRLYFPREAAVLGYAPLIERQPR
ncbi:hypothetical protein FisN_15Lu114 [Fistulifera solaris]|uniref:Uncharacterized protein n=1 Tax=Fistulifera solaris TaxID=1519565 RepID=A0A1Z5KAW6_FISSO|nr:hypothetical protein FisN_15Lu114 [Fistulifera solaris]|eukprot:GAX23394.1 hypothetical protein FisN_15Lu114 [Fistulifera solaris]